MATELTQRQREILMFIQAEIRGNGYPPTVREICTRFGMASPRAAQDHLAALERKGYITRRPGKSRGITMLRRTGGIPLVGRIAAGQPVLAYENVEGELDVGGFFGTGELFAVRVQGDSMIEAGIHDGDYVVVRKTDTVENGEIGVAYVGGEATVKRIFITNKGYRLQPENETLAPLSIEPDTADFRIGGPVVGVVRRL